MKNELLFDWQTRLEKIAKKERKSSTNRKPFDRVTVCLVSVVVVFALFILICHTAVAQRPLSLPAPISSGEVSHDPYLTPQNSMHPLSNSQSIIHRLEALEAENVVLRKKTYQLRQMVIPNGESVTPASYSDRSIDDEALSLSQESSSHELAQDQLCYESCRVEEPSEEICSARRSLAWKKGGWQIVPFGMLRGEVIYAGQATTADAVIFHLEPTQQGINDDTCTVHGKTSMLNFEITGPTIGRFKTGGLIMMNFLGPQPLRNTSGPNVLTAYGEIKNKRMRFAFGRMNDLFGPIAPNTVNLGQQRGAGNVGIYRGALHFDRYFSYSDHLKWTLSARISQQAVNDYLTIPQVRGKDNGWPNVEMRVGVEIGEMRDGVSPVELGVSGLIGETQAIASEGLLDGIISPALDDVATTWGLCIDAQIQGKTFGVRGEAWAGQAAGTYFMAALQSLNPNAQSTGIPTPIRSIGGWLELSVKPCNNLAFYGGFGIDDPNNSDTGFVTADNTVGQIRLNQVAWLTMKWNVSKSYELGFEVSHRKTHFINPGNASDAMLYHFSSSLMY